MKSRSITERERRLLASVASEYEKRGYEVKLRPTVGDMPEFMAGFEPDLIAIREDESVVVEVKARKEFQNEEAIATIEAALRNRPGWRFELIIDGSESEHGRLLGASEIGVSLEEANELQQAGHVVAAWLLLWSATEGILRLLATRERVEVAVAAVDGADRVRAAGDVEDTGRERGHAAAERAHADRGRAVVEGHRARRQRTRGTRARHRRRERDAGPEASCCWSRRSGWWWASPWTPSPSGCSTCWSVKLLSPP